MNIDTHRLFPTIGILTICLLGSASAHAAKDEPCDCSYIGKVTSIVDGDTFYMETAPERVRFPGIDTPERGRHCYQEAGYKLDELIGNKVVNAKCYKFDKYKRPVCRVFLDGQDVGLKMVELGYAWHAKAWAHEQHKDERRQYAEAEYKAMQDGRGCLWAVRYPSAE